MSKELKAGLSPVRVRLRRTRLLRYGARGMFVGAALAMALGLLNWGAVLNVGTAAVWAVLLVGTALGLAWGFTRREEWSQAATKVDEHFELKDRILSALHFKGTKTGSADADALRRLQVEDAEQRLETLKAGEAVRLGVPRTLPVAVVFAAIAVWLSGFSAANPEASADVVATPAAVTEQLEEIFEIIEELEERAEEEEDADAEELARELRELAEEMEEPGVDLREAVVKISEMQEMLAAAQAAFAEGVMDANLEALGKAMQGAEQTDSVGKALEEGDLAQAMEGLQQMSSNMDPTQNNSPSQQRGQKAAADRMMKASEQMSEDKLTQMSEATKQLAEGLKNQDQKQCQGAASKLGKMVEKHAQCKSMSKCMGSMSNKLAQCKSGMCDSEGNRPGNKNSLAKSTGKKSDNPSLNFGMGTHGGVDGPQTSIDSQRDLQKITGVLGAGDSEYETIAGTEQEESARRDFKQIHEDYEKLSEAVLESENIPLGYRENIRRYFEGIRPTTEELAAMEEAAKNGDD